MNVNGKSPLILLWTLLLAACAPAANNSDNPSLLGTTGYTSPEGYEYVSNGDTRVGEALRQPEPAKPAPGKPVAPAPTKPGAKPPQPTAKPLRERLKEFEISRFHANETDPARFGEARMVLKVIFNGGQRSVEFKTNLIGAKPRFQVNATSNGYTLTGELSDSEHQTQGDFVLTHLASKESARIFYWAYKAKLKVRENRLRQVVRGSTFENQLTDLRDNSFGWVNNWNVLRGPSFFLVDIVRLLAPNSSAGGASSSLLSFKGPSLRTGEAVHDVDEISGAPSTIRLVGNGEEDAGRIFQVSMQDPESKESNEFMLDVELDSSIKPHVQQHEGQAPAPVPIPDEVPEEPEVKEDYSTSPPKPPGRQETEEIPRNGKSYLRINSNLARTSKMTRDFNRNRNLTGVKQFIENYKGNWRSQLQKFYTQANPFRRIIEKVGQTFDVSPAFAYLTVIESRYFYGGRYQIESAGTSTALGPFQLLEGTARELGLAVGGGNNDERRYFVPSSCGAAKYIGKLVDKFDDSDATVSILAYFQGDGGAAAAIFCSYDTNAGDRKACAARINKSFKGADYGRFLRLTKNYNYSYAEMDSKAAIPKHMRDYVNKKLAIYFISNDMNKYGFTVDGAPTRLPTNGTVMPQRALKDRACQTAVAPLL